MRKDTIEQLELSLVGIFFGALAGGIWFVVGLQTAIAGAIIGAAVLGIIFGNFYRTQTDMMKVRSKFAVKGLLVGTLIGGAELRHLDYWGNILGAIAGVGFYWLVVGKFVGIQKEKGNYNCYNGGILLGSCLGFSGASTGLWLTNQLFGPQVQATLLLQIAYHLTTVILPLLCSLIFSLPLGFLLVANLQRPVIGSVLALMGGIMILWVGINIAPILFIPGSGLYWSGLVIGLFVCTTAIFAVAFPKFHTIIGAITVVLSTLSFVGAAGGLLVGGLFALLGGSLMVAWNHPAIRYQSKVKENNYDQDNTLSG